MPTPFLGNQNPYEKLHGTIYDIESIRLFGFLCFSSILTTNKKKLDPRVDTSVFLGFNPKAKGYITFDLKTSAIFVSRNVIFYEDCFSFTDQNKPDHVIVLLVPTPSSHTID